MQTTESEYVTFEPILKPKKVKHDTEDTVVEPFNVHKSVETFVSEEDTKRIVSQVFIAVGLMIAAMFLAFLLSWAYNKEKTLFITVYAMISLLFSALVISLVAVLRDKIDNMKIFYTLVGSTAFMSLFNVVMIIVFAVIASKRLRRNFVPNGVQEYINQ